MKIQIHVNYFFISTDPLTNPITSIVHNKKIGHYHSFPVLRPVVDHSLMQSKWGNFFNLKNIRSLIGRESLKKKTNLNI